MERPKTAGFTLIEMVIVIAVLAALAGLVVPMLSDQNRQTHETVRNASLNAIRNAWTGSPASPGLIADLKFIPGFTYTNRRNHDLMVQGGFPAFDAVTGRGWRGPYVTGGLPVLNLRPGRQSLFPAPSDQRFAGDATFEARGFYGSGGVPLYGVDGDVALGDEWGNPIVLQVPPLDAGNPLLDSELKCWRYARLVSAGSNGILETSLADRLAERLIDNSVAGRGDDVVLFLNRVDVYE